MIPPESIKARLDLNYNFFVALSRHDVYQVALAGSGGVPIIFAAMMHHRADSKVCKFGCFILSQIVSRDAANYKDTVMAAGGVAFAYATMANWPDDNVWATGLISALK